MVSRLRNFKNVFAAPISPATNFRPPVHKKPKCDSEFLERALRKNFVFEHVQDSDMKPLVDAFESISYGADHVLINQGDKGDFFYVILTGACTFYVNDEDVGAAVEGDSFGELALLYTCPRAATVKTMSPTVLYRLEQKTFRFILQSQTQQGTTEKMKLLRGVPFLKDCKESDLTKLLDNMTPARFEKDHYLLRKGDESKGLHILQEGTARIKNLEMGHATYHDFDLKAGDYVGDEAWFLHSAMPCDVLATSPCLTFYIKIEAFDHLVEEEDFQEKMLRARDKMRLAHIPLLDDADLDERTLEGLSRMLVDKTFPVGTNIVEFDEPTEATLYLIRHGAVKVVYEHGEKEDKVLNMGGFFGEETLMADVGARKMGYTKVHSNCTATVVEELTCGVLTLQDARKVVDTRTLGQSTRKSRWFDSIAIRGIKLNELKRHKILGAGTFGQVWLVSRVSFDGKRVSYALKVQSKFELVQERQAHAVVNEKNVMAKLGHPFLLNLVQSYKDKNFVYMLIDLVPGGELYSLVYDNKGRGRKMPEDSAMFYTACIAEGLGYMHRRGFAYRDLKPENIMINARGYGVVIDFGFTKYVSQKTYTLCGTPLYLPPEMILNSGHNWAVDHWALGIMIYEMFTGRNPFQHMGMSQMQLFQSIVKCRYKVPSSIPSGAKLMIESFLIKDPTRRLGNLEHGEDDVIGHVWFKPINFNDLREMKITAPFVPEFKDPLDTSNFDDWSHLDDKTKMHYPNLSAEDEAIFAPF